MAQKEQSFVVYTPYITKTSATIINGIKVWDYRWWVNIWCKINWFLHFKQRKRWKEMSKIKVDSKYFIQI
jgi:hypothetical protein